MENFLKTYGALIGVLVTFIAGYIKFRENVSSLQAKFDALSKKLEEVETKMDKRDGEHYGRLTTLEVEAGKQSEKNVNVLGKIGDMTKSLEELRKILIEGISGK